MSDDYELVEVTSREQWHAWLSANHDTSPGIGLVTWKKGRGAYVANADIVGPAC